MASREGQGMQIMVILSALVTVLLAIFTYVFYAEANKLRDELTAAQATAETNLKGQNSALYKLTALKYTMGMATASDLEAAKSRAGAPDEEVDKWIAQFKADAALVGDDPANPKENYISIVGKLLSTINQKNISVSEMNKAAETIQQQKDQAVADLTKEKESAEKTAQDAVTNYTAKEASLTDQNNQQAQQLASLKTVVEDSKKAADEALAAKEAVLAQQTKNFDTLKSSFSLAQATLEKMQKEAGATFDNADGKIVWVNQRQRLVWIDLGSADGLTKQMTFSVFSQTQASAFKLVEQPKLTGGREQVPKLTSKGRIEVVSVRGPHEAECRILSDTAADPIMPGDWIQTPAWSPGQHYGFALAGPMDIDDDGLDDTELIKNLIRVNGGQIDAELTADGKIVGPGITVRTRYMVEGKLPTDSTDTDAKAMLAGVTKMEDQRKLNGVEKISVGELLERMGWEPEEKTIGLSGRSDTGSGQFRRRSPAGAAPAEGTPPESTSEPMPTEPAEKAEPAAEPTDPFGTK